MTTNIALIATLIILAVPASYAQEIKPRIDESAYSYYTQCRASATSQETNAYVDSMCTYFSVGLLNGLDFGNVVLNSITRHYFYKLPEGVAYGQKMLIVIKYMENHPKELDKATTVVFMQALTEAYPAK